MSHGFFITFEGGEGVGKTTQIQYLCDALRSDGKDVLTTREPGGTPAAEKIRDILSDPDLGPTLPPAGEAMLIAAARAAHVQNVIRPALDGEKIVICDRFIDSTRVYQEIIQGQDKNFIDQIIQHATDGLEPNLTFIFDLPAKDVMARVQSRGVRDHYDDQDESFHTRIRDAFLSIAKNSPERCVIVDASRPINEIADKILAITKERMHV